MEPLCRHRLYNYRCRIIIKNGAMENMLPWQQETILDTSIKNALQFVAELF